jgi:hypothetical protein
VVSTRPRAALQEKVRQLDGDDDESHRERERDDAGAIQRKARARAEPLKPLGHLRVPHPALVSPRNTATMRRGDLAGAAARLVGQCSSVPRAGLMASADGQRHDCDRPIESPLGRHARDRRTAARPWRIRAPGSLGDAARLRRQALLLAGRGGWLGTARTNRQQDNN